ncbi:DUF222 domain-containing protein, partial [Mycolicibacterium moriokaense]
MGADHQEFAGAGDGEVVAAISGAARAEAIANARRLAAIAALTRRRLAERDDDDERSMWVCDPWDSAVAEVSAALNIGRRRASGQMCIALALRDRLPKVGARHAAGELGAAVIAAITWCTHLVLDPETLGVIDTALAEHASARWNGYSAAKLRQAIEVWIHRYDPDAVRRSQTDTAQRDFTVGASEDTAETTMVWGRLWATDAAVLKKRIAAMIAGVCSADPRSAA